jgi:cytochrome c553
MSNVVVHGRQPHVRGCAMCYMPNGKGRPENAAITGQTYEYIVQQLMDFRRGLRASAEPRKTTTAQ